MKNLKTRMMAILFLCMTLVLAACGQAQPLNESASGGTKSDSGNSEKPSDEKIVLKVASVVPANTHDQSMYLTEPWMERVKELTNNKVEFEYYPAEQIGGALEILDLTKNGVTDITIVPANYYASNMPLSNMIAGIPGLHETPYQGKMAYLDLVNENEEFRKIEFDNNGIKFLGVYITATYSIFTKDKPVQVPEDVKGLQVRSPGGTQSEAVEFLGGNPISLVFSEVYESMERNVVNSIIYYNIGLEPAGIADIIGKGANTKLGSSLSPLFINEKKFQGLPADVKEALIQAGQEVTAEAGEVLTELEKEFVADFEERGVFTKMTPEQEDLWNKAYEDFQTQWLKKNENSKVPYQEVLDQYKELLKKYE